MNVGEYMDVWACAGCAQVGGCRLGLARIRRSSPTTTEATGSCPVSFEGAPGVAHGGWTAAILDDFIGKSIHLHGVFAVTAVLTVAYKRPITSGPSLRLSSEIVDESDRHLGMSAELSLAQSGAVLATAHGRWAKRSRDQHFAEHVAWQHSQEGDR